jgi:hypothetical protein
MHDPTTPTLEDTMRDPVTLGPLYRTTDAYDAFGAWQADDTQWIFDDGATYLVGYAPAIFLDAPMAQGWRIACPEELMQRVFAA